MSGSWLDFDPLSHAKPKPAAPVTSMEQAEVRPQKQPDATVKGYTNEPKDEQASLPSSEESQPADTGDLGPLSVASRQRPSQPDKVPEHSQPQDNDPSRTRQRSPTDVGPTPDETAQLAPPKSKNEPTGEGDREESDPEGSDEKMKDVQMVDNELIAAPTEPARTSGEHIGESSSASTSQWPPKLDFSMLNNEESKHGDLRKNSIAAMKELGSPLQVLGDAPAEEDESLPSFDFQKFMTCLRAKSADPITRYIKSFLQEFCRAVWRPSQQEKIVHDFHKFISIKLRDFEPFASMNKRERLNSLEGVEKLVMNRLYTRTFPPKIPPILRSDGHIEDLLNDHVFEEKLRLWGWVEGRHLDIREDYLKSSFINLATAELSRLHQFKSPRDKMICILNCSKVIYALIRQAKLESNADSFLPLLIYVLIKSHPVHLISTINYIQRFRAKEFQRGETAYYLSTLASAVTFVQTLDQTSLTITKEEFEQRMTDAAAAEGKRKHQQQAEAELLGEGVDPTAHEGESSAAVLTASAGMLVDRMKKLTSKFIEDLTSPEENDAAEDAGGNPAEVPQPEASSRRPSANYRDQERAAKEASQEEFRIEQTKREQFEETSATLQNMFPSLDKDLIEDILMQNGTNIGSSVDTCLALVNEN